MKPLKKHPKQQRMEDITFPIQKPKKTFGIHKTSDIRCIHNVLKSVVCVRCREEMEEKVTWEGREWLRSINDDRHEWHVLGWVILGVSIIISFFVLWHT